MNRTVEDANGIIKDAFTAYRGHNNVELLNQKAAQYIHRSSNMKPKQFVPAAISSLRIAVLPLFIFFYSARNVWMCLGLMVFCVVTDYLDGYTARKLAVATKRGAYFDASVDFFLMLGIYSFFTLQSFYPVWLVVVIAVAFAQFIVTSLFSRKLYDPVGRYLGSALYIGIALTLLLPGETTFLFVQYAFLVFFVVSLTSRIISLVWKPAKNPPP